MSYEGNRTCWVAGQIGLSGPTVSIENHTAVFQFRNAAKTSGSITYNQNFIQPQALGPHKVEVFMFGVNKRCFPYVRVQLVTFRSTLLLTQKLPAMPVNYTGFGATGKMQCTYTQKLDPVWLTDSNDAFAPTLEERGLAAPPSLRFTLSTSGGSYFGSKAVGDDTDLDPAIFTESDGVGALGIAGNTKVSLCAALGSGFAVPLAGKYDAATVDSPIGHVFEVCFNTATDINWSGVDTTGGFAIYITVEYINTGAGTHHGGGFVRIAPHPSGADRRPALVGVQRSALAPVVVSNTIAEPVPIIDALPLKVTVSPGDVIPTSLSGTGNFVQIETGEHTQPIHVLVRKSADSLVDGSLPPQTVLEPTCVPTWPGGLRCGLTNDIVPVGINAVSGDVIVGGAVPVAGSGAGQIAAIDVNIVGAGGVALTEGKVPVTTLKNDETGALTNDPLSVILCDLDGYALTRVPVDAALVACDTTVTVTADEPLATSVSNVPLWVTDCGSDPMMAKRGLRP